MKTFFVLIARKLDQITMYRTVMYGLGILILNALILSIWGVVSYNPLQLLISIIVLLGVAGISQASLRRLTAIQTNQSSWIITGLILFFILPPAANLYSAALLALAALIAMVSKFVLVYRGRIIFNPAALAATALGVSLLDPAIWWIGSRPLFFGTLLIGTVIVWKLRRVWLVLGFILSAGIVAYLTQKLAIGNVTSTILFSSPLIFLGTFMLTEPETTPPRVSAQLIYAGVVGILFSITLHIGRFYITPEVALLVGNVVSYGLTRSQSVQATLTKRIAHSPHIVEFIFTSVRPMYYTPGQYAFWTLQLPKNDKRGNRRSFSIASPKGTKQLSFITKFYEPSSQYKTQLQAMPLGTPITIGAVSGSFTLPKKPTMPIILIAGGVGVTPFLSMLRNLQTPYPQPITILYFVSRIEDYCFQDDWDGAKRRGISVVPILSGDPSAIWPHVRGNIDADTLSQYASDYQVSQIYLSGPPPFVSAAKLTLRSMGVRRRFIHSDYFSGY